MAISLSTISALAARDGNEWLKNQINFNAQILGKNGLQTEECSGQVYVVNVQAGGLNSVANIAGGGTYPTAASKEATQLLVRPVTLIGHVAIDIDAAELVSGKKDSVKLVKNQFDLLGKNLRKMLARQVFDSKLGACTKAGAISSGIASADFDDQTGWVVGQLVDLYDPGDTTKLGTGEITAFTRKRDGSSTVTFKSLSLTGSNVDAGLIAYVPGYKNPSAGFRFTSLVDLAGTADVYGTTVSNSDWQGYTTGSTGALTLSEMRDVCDHVASHCGEEPTHVIMSRPLFNDYEALHTSNRRYLEGDKLDAFGKNDVMPEFRGRPVIVDDSCPVSKVFFIHTDHVKLGVWKEFGPLVNGSGMAEVSQTVYSYLIKVSGMFNLLCDARNSIGLLKNIVLS